MTSTENSPANDMYSYTLDIKFDNLAYQDMMKKLNSADEYDGLPAPEAKVIINIFPFCVVFDRNFRILVSSSSSTAASAPFRFF